MHNVSGKKQRLRNEASTMRRAGRRKEGRDDSPATHALGAELGVACGICSQRILGLPHPAASPLCLELQSLYEKWLSYFCGPLSVRKLSL
jgi:hypothetical protein